MKKISLRLLRSYEFLIDKADQAFRKMEDERGDYMACKLHCSDCCNAVFGLFLIEAAYLSDHFNELSDEAKEKVLKRCDQADKDLEKLERIMETFREDPKMQAYSMARERIRCPLLGENDECALYSYRPITCRVYGIPTAIQGKARICGKAKFVKGEKYPIFNLDGAYRDLFNLSKELLSEAGIEDLDKASLLISVSKALRTPIEDFISEDPKTLDKVD